MVTLDNEAEDSNLRPIDRKSSTLPLCHRDTLKVLAVKLGGHAADMGHIPS